MMKHAPPCSLARTALITSLGYVVVQLDVTIVNVALPTFSHIFQADNATLQWIPDAYVIVFSALLLAAGGLSDRFGSRNVHLVGLFIFLVSSLVCAIAPSVGILIIGRISQGIGAALILPSSLSLLSFASGDNSAWRTKAIGWWSAIGGIISAAGPFIGGLILEWYSWPLLFLINIPVCLTGIVFTLKYVGQPNHSRCYRADTKGILLFVIACFALIFALIRFGQCGELTTTVLIFLGVFICAILLIYRHIMSCKDSFIPERLFRMPVFSISLILGAAMNFSFYGSIFMLSLYFQVFRGYSPVMTGLALLTFMVIALANTFSSYLSQTIGSRMTITLGMVISGMSYCILAILTRTNADYLTFVGFLFLMPIGGGIALPTLLSVFIHSAPREMTATASAAINAVRQAGGALGVALLGLLVSGKYFPVDVGASIGFTIATVVMAITALLVYVRFYLVVDKEISNE